MRLSVVMSVYMHDSTDHFKEAIESLLRQTVKADEIVLVVDGPIPEDLENLVRHYAQTIPTLRLIRLKENMTLGIAMIHALEAAQGNYLARFDSDDICIDNRFEVQLNYMEQHPEISVLGGSISEFSDKTGKEVGKRVLPTEHDDIMQFMKKRNGMNHMTVMFRRKDVLAAGNYQRFYNMEDYYLWCRMLMQGYRFANLKEVLVKVRVSKNMYARRSGWDYYKSEWSFYHFMQKKGFISYGRLAKNMFIRGVVHFFMPNTVRTWFYQTFLRAK